MYGMSRSQEESCYNDNLCMRGVFFEKAEARAELMELIKIRMAREKSYPIVEILTQFKEKVIIQELQVFSFVLEDVI